MVFKKFLRMIMGCLGFTKEPTQPETVEFSRNEVNGSNSSGSLRIKLSDGRFLAYAERGVPMNLSDYKVVAVHGFGSSKEMNFMASQELLYELKIYLLLYDRAGYGESDPNPKRSLKSEASDIEELADKLQLGSKFYILGISLGCYPVWSCLRRIPNRLTGVALVVPYINYKWPSLPKHLIRDDYRKRLACCTLLVTSYLPGLLHWWMTQQLCPSKSFVDRNPKFFCRKDLEVLKDAPGYQLLSREKLRNKSVFDSYRRDFIVAYGKWDFDPLQLSDPYPESESTVHIWQGYEDKVVPFRLQRHVSGKLPWIKYHEVRDGGHLLVYDSKVCEAIFRSLLLGEDDETYRPGFDE